MSPAAPPPDSGPDSVVDRADSTSHDSPQTSAVDASAASVDPVRARRRQIARWTRRANRVGYLCFGLAIVLFVLALTLGFTSTMSTLIIVSIVVGSILLAPAIVLGYAIKAAERDDRERGL